MIEVNQSNLLKCGDVIIVALPDHKPRAHEQQGTRPVIVVGIPKGETRYSMIVIAPFTTQTGSWSHNNHILYPQLVAGVGGLPKSSIVLLDQVRGLDVCRIVGYLGTLTAEQYKLIQEGLTYLFS